MNEVQAPVAHHEPWILKINILKYCLCTDILFFFLPSDDLPISMIALYLLKKKGILQLYMYCVLQTASTYFKFYTALHKQLRFFVMHSMKITIFYVAPLFQEGNSRNFFFVQFSFEYMAEPSSSGSDITFSCGALFGKQQFWASWYPGRCTSSAGLSQT